MGVDIRLPIGGMFTIFGILLIVYGVLTKGDVMYAHSLDVNINLLWGLVMLIFGGLMLIFGMRAKPKAPAATQGDRPAGMH